MSETKLPSGLHKLHLENWDGNALRSGLKPLDQLLLTTFNHTWEPERLVTLQDYREPERFCNVRFTIGDGGTLYFHAVTLMASSGVYRDILSEKAGGFGETIDIKVDKRFSTSAFNVVLNVIQKGLEVVYDAAAQVRDEVCAIMRQYDIDGWKYLLETIITSGTITMERIESMRALSLDIVTKDFAIGWAFGSVEIAGDVSQEIVLMAKRHVYLPDLIQRPWRLYENLDMKNADEKYIYNIAKQIVKAVNLSSPSREIYLQHMNSAKLTGIVPAIWDAAVAIAAKRGMDRKSFETAVASVVSDASPIAHFKSKYWRG